MPGADYRKVAGDDEAQTLAWLQHGPLSVSVAAGAFNGYKGGIISGQACNTTRVDHAVLLVGYGTDAATGTNYWCAVQHPFLGPPSAVSELWQRPGFRALGRAGS